MSGKSKKNKRGDRGSTDEELIDSKRANMDNMAANVDEDEGAPKETTEISEEPSRRELREMLVDIQITVNNILLENKKISSDVLELKATVQKQQSELATLKEALAKATKERASTKKELAAATEKLDEQQEEIAELYDLQDRLEQYTRKNSLEIHGIPEVAYTSTEEVVLKLANALEVPVAPQDIEISHKLTTKSGKAIIAKFISHKVKTNLYRARVKLKNIKVSDLFPGSSYATSARSEKIFLNENLTSYRRQIVNRANEKRRDGELLSVWTLDGTIFVKTSPEAKDLTVSIKKSEILPAIAPDHNAICISLALSNKCPRGPGFWKFNNTLLKDPQYIDKIRYTYTRARNYYSHLTDKRLFWQDPNITGIKIYENEIKLSQFADDTTLFNADLASLERALKITNDFGKIAGLSLNVKKTKAIWLGKWANNKNKPLNLKWFHSPVKILGIHFSYDEKRNNELNFIQIIQKLQTKLDMWSSRDLTIFGRAMILKTLGLSQLVYSVSNLLVPQGIADAVKTKSFKFLWRNKKDKIKRSGLYQEPDRGGIRMTDLHIMFKALKLAWIPRLLASDNGNWCTIPNHFFNKTGGLKFLLRCNYDARFFNDLPTFYKRILDNFNELKTLYNYHQNQDIVLFNNKEILVGGKPVFINEWFKKGIISIKDLLTENGKFLTSQEFSLKYSCQTNFLQYYQVISAIPKHLLSIAKQTDDFNKSSFISNDNIFLLGEAVQINLDKAKSRDFYNLLNVKTHNEDHTGPLRWSQNLSINSDTWSKIFKSLKSICKDTKLKEFQFKFIHRIIVTNKELFRFGIRPDDECLYCGDKDSIEHTFIECPFTKTFVQSVVQWFNQTNLCQIFPTTEEVLFGYFSSIWDPLDTDRIRSGDRVDTLWRQSGYAVDTEWIRSGDRVDTQWIQSGYGVEIEWIRSGDRVDTQWRQSGYAVDTEWKRSGDRVDTQWR
ncbi:hypothetical protein ACROYT_G034773 [Oculina patagonica]